MAGLDRKGLIDCLTRLGDESDASALEAARAAHRTVQESGLRWDEIIIRGSDQPSDSDPGLVSETDIESADIGRLIDRLMRRGVSDSLREELSGMKRQLADGVLDADDGRYVRALARRLGV